MILFFSVSITFVSASKMEGELRQSTLEQTLDLIGVFWVLDCQQNRASFGKLNMQRTFIRASY